MRALTAPHSVLRTAPRLGIRVMAHPRRRAQAEALLASLAVEDRLLVLDPDPDGPPTPLRTAARAWAGPYGTATHRLVLQDDVLPSAGFLGRVGAALAARPDDPIAFYANWNHWNGAAVRLAALSGAAWAEAIPDEYAPSLALALPLALAADFAAYARSALARGGVPDDEALAAFLRERGRRLYISVPNLVEHLGGDSLVGNQNQGPRLSACFADDAAGAAQGGTATLGALPFYPHFFKGHVYGLTPTGPGGAYVSTYWEDGARAQGIDPDDVRESAREPVPAALLNELTAGGLRVHHAASAWKAAVLYGVVLARLPASPGAGAGGAPRPHPAIRRRAVDTIPLGGLAQVAGLPLLHRLRDPLRDLTEAGLAAGAERARAGGRPPGPGDGPV
ncbi:hypothetical protein [Streptomyces sp. NPDC006368]|uniref:hypothetical protein n=1 Tax=Streptomyces sp. NPDC006368 TaxID=3156760 RepID=UPI0033A5193A